MLLSTSMPGVFQPLSSSHSFPLSGICPSWTQDSLSAEKKAHFVMSYLCSVQDSDERATAYVLTGLTYSLRSPAPNHNPAPSRVHAISLDKTIGFTQKLSFCQTCLSYRSLISSFFKRKCNAGLCVGFSYYPVLLRFQTTNTKSCLFNQTAYWN